MFLNVLIMNDSNVLDLKPLIVQFCMKCLKWQWTLLFNWNHIITNKLFVLDTNSWNHFTVYILYMLRIVPWSYNCLHGLVGRVFANGSGDLGSISGHVIPKILEMALDTSLLNTQQYKVRIKGKVKQSRERSSALSYT